MSHALGIARLARILSFTVVAGLLLSGCGINNIPTYEENAKAKWSDVQNQYQRRADLIPNLVETVKGYATQEREVLTQVTEARAKASQIKVDASTVTDPAKFKEFQDAQNAAHRRARAAAGHGRALSGLEVEPEFPGAAVAARRHREPHCGCAPRLHRGGARLQHRAQDFPGLVLWASTLYRSYKPMETFTVAEDLAEAADM